MEPEKAVAQMVAEYMVATVDTFEELLSHVVMVILDDTMNGKSYTSNQKSVLDTLMIVNKRLESGLVSEVKFNHVEIRSAISNLCALSNESADMEVKGLIAKLIGFLNCIIYSDAA